MATKRVRSRLQLTVDPAVWQECKALSEVVPGGINWSRVAEASFVQFLRTVGEFRDQLARLDKDQASTATAALMAYSATVEGNTGRARLLLDALEEQDRRP